MACPNDCRGFSRLRPGMVPSLSCPHSGRSIPPGGPAAVNFQDGSGCVRQILGPRRHPGGPGRRCPPRSGRRRRCGPGDDRQLDPSRTVDPAVSAGVPHHPQGADDEGTDPGLLAVGGRSFGDRRVRRCLVAGIESGRAADDLGRHSAVDQAEPAARCPGDPGNRRPAGCGF